VYPLSSIEVILTKTDSTTFEVILTKVDLTTLNTKHLKKKINKKCDKLINMIHINV